MSKSEKYIVLPFRKVRGQTALGEMRQASNEAEAERLATTMAQRYVGVAAYAVIVDLESGDMANPRLLCKFGDIADMSAFM